MPNRYVRDELIMIALDMVHLPNLAVHDAPNGVVAQDAYSIQWLQDIVDFWYHMVPFSASIEKTPLIGTANNDTITLPSDFILDVRNGVLVQAIPGDVNSYHRIHRVSLQKFLNRKLRVQGQQNVKFPIYYNIHGIDEVNDDRQVLNITPTPTINTTSQLWYYSLPPKLDAGKRPRFPNDYVCIEYLRIRALEHANIIDPGTAQKFCDTIVGGMKAAGLMNEPEDDEIPFNDLTYRTGGRSASYSWMGAP